MTSLVLDIDDWPVAPGAPAIIAREAKYFLLMTGSDVNVTWYRKGQKIGGAVGLQGGDGIGPLSDFYDKVVLESATSQTCKVATTSDPVTITRLSGVVQVDGVVEIAADYSRVKNNKAFSAQAGIPAVSGEYTYMQLWNPAGSGKDLVITTVYLRDPVTTTMVTDVQITAAGFNNFAEKAAVSLKAQSPVGESDSQVLKQGTSASSSALAGGTIGSFKEGSIVLPQPIVVTPGTGFALRSLNSGVSLTASMQYFEAEK